MKKLTGWLFDLYAHPMKGVVLWLVGEDGKPYSFHQDFEAVFYARGFRYGWRSRPIRRKRKGAKLYLRIAKKSPFDASMRSGLTLA